MDRTSRLARRAASLSLALLLPGLALPATAADDVEPQVDHRPVSLTRLQDDADARLRTDRDALGRLALVARRDGEPIDNPRTSQGTPLRTAARSHLERYGAALGVEQPAEWALTSVHPLGDGTVARFAQQDDGRPVLGGEVVVTMDGARDATSLLADVSRDSAVPAGQVGSDEAARTALRVVARSEQVPVRSLRATVVAKAVHDPALLPAPGALAPAEVWQLEVGNGTDVRRLVLVDTVTGRVRLHFDQVTDVLDRAVCDNGGMVRPEVPCTAPVRVEQGSSSAVTDVEAAFALTGETAALYDDVAGVDLTELIGHGAAGARVLRSTVRVCESSDDCPMANAYWNGAEMYYGAGFAVDDVVGHELTHGVVDRTSQLFYFHQSGAIDESLADVFGELLDRRVTRPGEPADRWLLAEESPLGALRDMADPIAKGQPDRMTSPVYETDLYLEDNGGVHTNSGVGNKTFQLLAEGGTFNGRTVVPLDTEATLPRTALLFYRAMTTLTSSSDYRDLAGVLEQRCAELAAAGTAGFTDAHCTSVAAAVAATELRSDPVDPRLASAEEPDLGCPAGKVRTTLLQSEGGTQGWTAESLWQRAPQRAWGIPVNATSGTTSWFGWNPDPAGYGDPATSTLVAPVVEVPAEGETYLAFRHWRLFEFDPAGPTYDDGGFVSLSTGWGGALDLGSQPWVNGPTDPVTLGGWTPTLGFGGDSHGWVTSRVSLGAFGGSTVRPRFHVRGDAGGSFLGWYLDDIEVYTCAPPEPPGSVASFTTAPDGTGARSVVGLRWQPPQDEGDGVGGFRVTRPDGSVVDLDADDNAFTVRDLGAGPTYAFSVAALGMDGTAGPATTRTVSRVEVRSRASATALRKNGSLTLSGQVVVAGTRTGLHGPRVIVQWRAPTGGPWRQWGTFPTTSDGRFLERLRVLVNRSYRIVSPASPRQLAAVGPVHRVRLR